MTKTLRRAVIGFAVFVVACLVSALTLTAIFAQLRIQAEQTYHAEFTDVSGLAEGDFVRIAGVEVGKVKKISINQNNVAVVEFSADPTVVLTGGTKAALRWADPIGTRYMTLLEGAGGVQNSIRVAPSRSIAPNRRSISMSCWAASGRCSVRWIPNRSTPYRVS